MPSAQVCNNPYFYLKLVYEMVGKMSTALSYLWSRTASGFAVEEIKYVASRPVQIFWIVVGIAGVPLCLHRL